MVGGVLWFVLNGLQEERNGDQEIQGDKMYFKAPGGTKVNVAVLAYEDSILWDYRNFLYAFMKKTSYNLGITLTKTPVIIVNGMTFVKGGLDVVVVADVYCEEKYAALIGMVSRGLYHTKFIFLDAGNSKKKAGTSAILVSSKEELERQLRKEIIKLLLGEVDIIHKK